MNDLARVVRAAHDALDPSILRTPLVYSAALSDLARCRVYLKQENLQITGSCKARSAWTNLLAIAPERRAQGVVTASTGNNGIATAWAARRLGIPATVLLPRSIDDYKAELIRQSGMATVMVDGDIVDAETQARRHAQSIGATYCSPYNSWEAVYGQATIALEVLEQLAELGARADDVVVPVGGGGLISGIAAICDAVATGIRVTGVQPIASAVMARSVAAGRLLELSSRPTISDATMGGVEGGSITFELCRRLVDDFLLVEERDLKRALLYLLETHDLLVEGSGALAVAALLGNRARFAGRTVVLLLCGANIDPSRVARWSADD
ncbi:MAG: pyridoxal-phosphate dependent enzyme [Myxococcales bacterium]|nr:pyridoxal-phosphate dependent enzyme [Myxococcales bacterium]